MFCAHIWIRFGLNSLILQHIVVLPDIYWNPFVSYFRDATDVLYIYFNDTGGLWRNNCGNQEYLDPTKTESHILIVFDHAIFY